MSTTPQNCNLCGGSRHKLLYGALHEVTDTRFFRCLECGLIQTVQTVSANEEAAFYRDSYHALDHKRREPATRVHLFERILDRVERQTGGRRLLDVGCGTGEFVAAARARGWDAEGLDVSPQAVLEGNARHGAPLHEGTLGDWRPPADSSLYDVVSFLNVLDQLPDPATALDETHALLSVGGWVCIRVPNARLHHLLRGLLAPFPRLVRRYRLHDIFSLHLYSFTGRTLRSLLGRHGFECVRVANSPVTRGDPSARSSGWRLCLFQSAKVLAWLTAEAVRALSLGRLHVAPSILVMARKGQGKA